MIVDNIAGNVLYEILSIGMLSNFSDVLPASELQAEPGHVL